MTSPTENQAPVVCEPCEAPLEERRKGYVYAIATAILCPCHMPVWGVLLGGSAAGAVFDQYFWSIAVGFGVLSLLTFAGAAKILLLSRS